MIHFKRASTSFPLACFVAAGKRSFSLSLGGVSGAGSPAARKLTMDGSSTPAYSWCCTASVNPKSSAVAIQKVVGYDDRQGPFQDVGGRSLDVTTSPGWMEYIEFWENRRQDEGGAGAYDTLRCDLILNTDSSDCWRKWGEEFHLHRLQNSYRSLMRDSTGGSPGTASDADEAVEAALQHSYSIMNNLLEEASRAGILRIRSETNEELPNDVEIQLIRLTVLWSPSHSSTSDIVVRGHACSSAKAKRVHEPVKPIVATIAAVGHHDDHSVTMDQSMPTRFRDPQNKVASWTRLRKKMENPQTYKPPGVSEVLMVRPCKGLSDLEVLEGLSSNFFVIYSDLTIRTAQDGVLHGYVRNLVLDSIESCGLKLDRRPILLQEAQQGLWKEAFITSSSRLIFPISEILVHSEDESGFEVFWHDHTLTTRSTGTPRERSKWQDLLDELLRKGGYPVSTSVGT